MDAHPVLLESLNICQIAAEGVAVERALEDVNPASSDVMSAAVICLVNMGELSSTRWAWACDEIAKSAKMMVIDSLRLLIIALPPQRQLKAFASKDPAQCTRYQSN